MSLHPLADAAEIAILFPEQSYIGNFGRQAQLDTHADADAVAIRLVRCGEDPREATIHLHYGVLAEVLGELATALSRRNRLGAAKSVALDRAARRLCAVLERG